MAALVSWSGGKDSCLALHRARGAGVEVSTLLAVLDETGTRTRSHGVTRAAIAAQARALGADVRFASASWTDYEAHFVEALEQARADGIDLAIFGDIDLLAHREWEEKVCARAGLRAMLPLWDEPRAKLVDEFLDAGFRARVVCVDARFLDAGFVDCEFDRAFIARLPAGVDACGENGEFHTFVYDGPGFGAPVRYRRLGVQTVVSPPEFGRLTYHFGLLDAD